MCLAGTEIAFYLPRNPEETLLEPARERPLANEFSKLVARTAGIL
tara:strand:+ start:2816 stop:2950 length:135 start_codon:yes stop_codon:yes gene_type:complete